MTSIFLYLTLRTLRNRVVRRLKRLREPRYALGLLAGLAYFYFMVFRQTRHSRRFGPDILAGAQQIRPLIEMALASVAGTVLLGAWLWPVRRFPLEFTQAEVQFLFTAPISRQSLIHYKLLRMQLGILSGSLIASFFMGRLGNPANWPTVLGIWVLFATLHLHLIVTGFVQYGIAQQVHPNRWRLLIVLVAAVLVGTVVMTVQPALAAASLPDLRDSLLEASQQFPLKAILLPFRIAAAPLLALSPGAVAMALPPALALLLLHYFGAVRFRSAFEEMAAEAAERKARQKELRRGGRTVVVGARRRAPFVLKPIGRPEVALLWKNLVQMGRFWNARTLAGVAIPIAVALTLGLVAARQGIALTIAIFAGFGAAALSVLGPQMFRNDLRRDLLNLEMIKGYPMTGRQIVRGEILAPWVCLLVLQGVLLVIVWTASLRIADVRVQKFASVWFFLAAVILAPAVSLLGVLIQNAIALTFPGWVSSGSHRSRGIETMGQGIVLMIAHVVSLALLLLPAVAAAVLLGGAVYWIVGWPGITIGAIAAAAVVFVEAWLGTHWLGHLFEKTDPRQVEVSEE